MNRKAEIQVLLDKYRQNRCTPEELRLLEELLQTSALKDDVGQLLCESLLDGIPSSFLEQPEVQETLHRVFDQIMESKISSGKPSVFRRRLRLWAVASAAIILLSLSAGLFWYSIQSSPSRADRPENGRASCRERGCQYV